MKFNIGDKAWVARSGTVEKWITCPDCLGQKFLTIIMGDGSQHTIDCVCCTHGCDNPRGQMRVYEFEASVQEITIDSIELSTWPDREPQYNHNDESCVFATKEEAEQKAESFRATHVASEENRLRHLKENTKKTWAWNVTYHRRELNRAKQQVEYHSTKLEVAKLKAKQTEPELA